MNQPGPWVSMPVHYVSHGTPVREDGTQAYPSACRAAIVTEVHDARHGDTGPVKASTVGLHVVNPTGQFFRSLADGGSKHSQLGTPGSWHLVSECHIAHAQPTCGKEGS